MVPYFGNLAARALLPEYPAAVRCYMEWYLAKLNRADHWSLAGTICDYELRDGRLEATGRYDSADSYAATFLSLAAASQTQ